MSDRPDGTPLQPWKPLCDVTKFEVMYATSIMGTLTLRSYKTMRLQNSIGTEFAKQTRKLIEIVEFDILRGNIRNAECRI